MKLERTDPRITAFALGELEDEERAEVQEVISQDGDLGAIVAEIEAAARAACDALALKEEYRLTESQRSTLFEAALVVPRGGMKGTVRRYRTLRFAAFAALLALSAAGLVFWSMRGQPRETNLARIPVVKTSDAPVTTPGDKVKLPEVNLVITEDVPVASPGSAPVAAPVDQPDLPGLQNVQVGGAIRIRGNYYATDSGGSKPGTAAPPESVAPLTLAENGSDKESPHIGNDAFLFFRSREEARVPQVQQDQQELEIVPSAGGQQNASPVESATGAVQDRSNVGDRFFVLAGPKEETLDRTKVRPGSDGLPEATERLLTEAEVGPKGLPRISGSIQTVSPPPSPVVTYDVNGDGMLENAPLYVAPDGREIRLRYTDTPQGASGNGGFDPALGAERSRLAQGGGGGGGGTPELLGLGFQARQQAPGGQDWGFNGVYVNRPEGINVDYERFVELRTRTGSGESYARVQPSAFVQVTQEPLSTFSVDVDTASYSNVRRFLTQGQVPPPEAVRVEEMINYFDYEYAAPAGADPIAVHVEIADCPWRPEHRLARVALKAREVPMDDRGGANLVFLIDVSGSMKDPGKLPLLKESMKSLTRRLLPSDRVSIVTYRDAASVALAPTVCDDKESVLAAIDTLQAQGSTNGAGGLDLAYTLASKDVIAGGINRVILATDGDFNVGETDTGKLVTMIRNSAAAGVFLTVLGFGTGNIKDDRLEALADKGNGSYFYIDNYNEANRVLSEQVGATLATVAKDVKVQVEFNPARVSAYRLIGYENRALAAPDFNDDRKDAGEMGSAQAVTALYELVPAGEGTTAPGVDPLKYQPVPEPPAAAEANPETMTVKIRYKDPEGDVSRRFEVPVVDEGEGYDQSSRDFRWASAVAMFGMALTNAPDAGNTTLDLAQRTAEGANGYDPNGHRAEFISLVVAAKTMIVK